MHFIFLFEQDRMCIAPTPNAKLVAINADGSPVDPEYIYYLRMLMEFHIRKSRNQPILLCWGGRPLE